MTSTVLAEKTQQPTLASVQASVALLAAKGADKFAAVRLAYIQSMLRRAESLNESVSALLVKKSLQACQHLQADFDRAQQAAKKHVASIAQQFTDAGAEANALFEVGDFSAIKQLQNSLSNSQQQSPLHELTQQIMQGGISSQDVTETSSFDELLRQQEHEIVQSFTDSLPTPTSSSSTKINELKSLQFFRASWSKNITDTLVSRALNSAPENAGPLNPQKLVTKTLSAMRDISPEYVGRLVSHVDDLLWLEKAGQLANKKSRRKGS